MVDFRRGIIAGVVAATVFLIISVILEVTGLADRSWVFFGVAGRRMEFYSTEPLHVLAVVLPMLVEGVMFGAVFAALYVCLPGRTAVRKAIGVSLMIWAIGPMQVIYQSLRWPWQAEGMSPDTASYGTSVITVDLGGMLISIASAVAFGALAGAIWNRLKGREAREPRPGNAALLVGFAIGVWMWLGPASRVIVDVAFRGPFWDTLIWWWPERFYWPGILFLSAAVLGLAGWILVLLGWRRTRRGETGFGRGLVGGVMMAVTGHMLLPAILSMIGAVLSRREPLVEPVNGFESVAR